MIFSENWTPLFRIMLYSQRQFPGDVPSSISTDREVPKSGSARFAIDLSDLVGPDTYQLLAEISAFQKAHERGRCAVEPFGNELLVLDLALAHPLRHVAQEIAVTRGKIADDETAEGQALGQDIAHHRCGPFRRLRVGVVVMGDKPADRHPRERIEQREHRLEHGTADIFKIDVDAL